MESESETQSSSGTQSPRKGDGEFGGGLNWGGFLKSVEVYDPLSKRWSFVAELSTPRREAGAVAYNGRIYVVGGGSDHALNSTEVYDPLLNTWSTLPAQMSTGRQYYGVALL